MSDRESVAEYPRVTHFWRTYLDTLRLFRIPERARPWYRRYVESFMRAHSRMRLAERSADSVTRCLEAQDRNPTLARTCKMIDKAVDAADNPLGVRFPDQYRRFLTVVRTRGYSVNTEKSCLGWINRYFLFHKDKHPFVGAEQAVASFLEHLALKRKVASATQAQSLNALVFIFTQVLEQPLGKIRPFRHANPPRRLPTVLSPTGVQALSLHLHGSQSRPVIYPAPYQQAALPTHQAP